jgi:L-glyceraldehyde 3-phosphate reductase
MSYVPSPDRYAAMPYRRLGRSGLDVPAISLGFWQNFGDVDAYETCREIVLRAFDRGVTHFDLANNYGPPNGAAEEVFGRILARDLKNHRDELVITTKAGWGMWDGPYGNGGSRKYLRASLDQSLRRLGLDYVDIFYSHRPVLDTPLAETMGALADSVKNGKATYVGVSSYSPAMTEAAADLLESNGVPLLVHQPSYSMLNRWIEDELLDTLERRGVGLVAFSPLAQGMLTNKYLASSPAAAGRSARVGTAGNEFDTSMLSEQNLANIRELNAIAERRGQTLAQLALTWALRDQRVSSVIVGARTVEQLDNSLDALDGPSLDADVVAEIDEFAIDGGIDLWRSTASLAPAEVAHG